ncbi:MULTISPECIES: exodeoxyribonuclease III [Chryseobacterium]|uniref:Exodeoxyribonuclease-3 n=1 Tax=Chryseobacterium camelliae TaxID=1265445 RepID=A0ABU0TGN6_9FLAO|nr:MULTISPECIES: exodeoxyribonuclease III [Chryseobacterium]MDT3405973.1 exodeoxyribonuclease-3 [Pseudacidovorax intermedius]MDQ1096224.1 exodeoxyribonuclease-3 [Chryseobacterium camelliae]MDQ1100161.1 exodeoxyribonuclease-3 [Chryseobacterium sp. SORGH_AS_1048]MDR6087504.1 exodeoxyribonuclease-3 [Chryseobacterium sp. SORGH_AS_0909]MDR6131878.1 exodeoxyribonuclease-3 [Chryseobacterium sp. SORGH_AS_1175]
MKIATYNVNGINARLPVLLRWLEEAKPDIVCLQELKAPQERFPEKEINTAGYQAIWKGQKSWNGVAILTRNLEITKVQDTLPGDPGDEQSRYLEAIIDQMVICCLYLPNGNPYPGPKFDYKLSWLKRLKKRTDELITMDLPAIIIGDFNIIPEPIDVHKPERWENDALYRIEIRKAYQNLLKKGWLDSIRTLFPEEKIYTFWDYMYRSYDRDAGIRLDHILLSPYLKSALKSGGVDRNVRGWEKTSDHAPTWVCIEK